MSVADVPGKSAAELKESVTKLYTRINGIHKDRDAAQKSMQVGKAKATRRAEARKKKADSQAVFKKYASKDGSLQKKDIVKYAKGESKFTLTDAAAENIVKILGADGKGVSAESFQRVKVAVGVQRE